MPMVEGPSDSPPGFSPVASTTWWCTRHNMPVSKGDDGQYWCPGGLGHRLEHDEAPRNQEVTGQEQEAPGQASKPKWWRRGPWRT
jgi:hypothetical protein